MDLKEYLIREPRARLRRNKNRAIANVIIEKLSLHEISKDKITDMVGEILSLDRKWRAILEKNPELRGSDYDDKDKLEEDYQKSLGYNI